VTFVDAVSKYVADHIKTLEEDYQWEFSSEKLPLDMNFDNDSWLNKNIYLRNKLHAQWNISTSEQRLNIVRWYIVEWGGVTGNKLETLIFYASSKPEQLIGRGTMGIASWSKALSVVDPMRFAIFDARVSSSLNSIQIINNVSDPRYFPDLPSKNRSIIESTAAVKSAIKNRWKPVNMSTFYYDYNALLRNIAAEIGDGITPQKVEMVLFARAVLLANAIQTEKWRH
jgi:hypothetical protein